jgi:hypothetical protein
MTDEFPDIVELAGQARSRFPGTGQVCKGEIR